MKYVVKPLFKVTEGYCFRWKEECIVDSCGQVCPNNCLNVCVGDCFIVLG